jgi:hypothetical protein
MKDSEPLALSHVSVDDKKNRQGLGRQSTTFLTSFTISVPTSPEMVMVVGANSENAGARVINRVLSSPGSLVD